jgi:hypothetical protein
MSNFTIYSGSGNDIDLFRELFERVAKLEKRPSKNQRHDALAQSSIIPILSGSIPLPSSKGIADIVPNGSILSDDSKTHQNDTMADHDTSTQAGVPFAQKGEGRRDDRRSSAVPFPQSGKAAVSEVKTNSSLVLGSGFLGINHGVLYQNETVTALANQSVPMNHGFSFGDIVTSTKPNFVVQVTKAGIYKISFGCTTTNTDVYLNLYKNINDIKVSNLFCTRTKQASRELFCSLEANDVFRLVFNTKTEISDAFLTIQRIN